MQFPGLLLLANKEAKQQETVSIVKDKEMLDGKVAKWNTPILNFGNPADTSKNSKIPGKMVPCKDKTAKG